MRALDRDKVHYLISAYTVYMELLQATYKHVFLPKYSFINNSYLLIETLSGFGRISKFKSRWIRHEILVNRKICLQ